ncbi:MAG: hypothetical protein KGH56_02045 [Patescibacteria group bacterium]|nr:hypothetical protein [Patescibacteria group bacterium]
MAQLFFILSALILLGGFFALTIYEERRGTRFLAAYRARLDHDVERVEFILAHVDFKAFLIEEVRRVAARVGHDIAHLSLLVVRGAERLLTRTVRYLRTHHAVDATPRETARGYVKTLSDFKDRLKATRPVREASLEELR